jgi:hypothetical protein
MLQWDLEWLKNIVENKNVKINGGKISLRSLGARHSGLHL